MQCTVKELQVDKVGYDRVTGNYYIGTRSAYYKENPTVEILDFDNEDDDFTTADTLLSSNTGVRLHLNASLLERLANRGQTILCSYEGEVLDGGTKLIRWNFVEYTGIDNDAEGLESHYFDTYGSINFTY